MSRARDIANFGDGITDADLPAGSVLQVVSEVLTNEGVSSSIQTYADTGVTASITPTSATSTVLVFVHLGGVYKNAANTYIRLKLLRDSTDLIEFENLAGFNNLAQLNGVGACSTAFEDSPNTTSEVTYKVQIANAPGVGTVSINQTPGGGTTTSSTITLMEIAG